MQHADERLRAGESADDRRPAARRVSMRAAIATPEGGQIDAALARWKPADSNDDQRSPNWRTFLKVSASS
ncbi:hypothetical protein [Caballeronia sp. AZ7_KS35]|uniref:hypothetical protein n=1 Tax=Caballeronia sp. AZ7_KS35 TaxID=2921762 RepID=UPI0020289875|nr:hypothetical protein [Caballeronia sp. AZ7_KS35]